MHALDLRQLVIRDAEPRDVGALDALRPRGALHGDWIGAIEPARFQYLIALLDDRIAGSVKIHFKADPGWPRPEQVPLMLDLWVAEPLRGKGIGRRLIEAVEQACVALHHHEVYLQVEPEENPRALALYQRLGYCALQSEPYADPYRFVDSAGNVEEGVEWSIDMRKRLV